MNKDFFVGNRRALADQLDGEVIILGAYTLLQRSGDAAFHFEQEANFWYLTGIDSPGWKLIIDHEESWLIAPDVDDIHQIFDGSMTQQEAKRISGVDTVLTCSEGESLLLELSKKYTAIYSLGEDPHKDHYDFVMNPGPVLLYKKLQETFESVKDCRKVLASLRAIKQPVEIEAMRRAIELTVGGFNKVNANMHNYSHEYGIEADFTHYFRSNGASGHAYDPIVAAGKNACTLHYDKNQAALENGQLILLDVGARVDGYAADITRTYAYGEITDRQRAVHVVVEKAHREIIELLKPNLNVKEYFDTVDDIMKEALDELGLIKTPSDYRKYFPHSISHGLGIDVHDSLGGPETFQPGMVLTVEPGIYIPEEGIGVRIEDDILITETGYENLSIGLPTSL